MIISCIILLIVYNSLNATETRFAKPLDKSNSYLYEEKLVESLLKNYNKKIRAPNTVQVNFAFNLNQIINLIEKDQIVVLNAFVDHAWIDTRLKWNPEDYGNLSIVRIGGDKLWT